MSGRIAGSPPVMTSVFVCAAALRRRPSISAMLRSGPSKRLGFAELDCGHIALAVDEALCNIMTHGYEQRMDQPIWLSLWPLDPDGGKPGIKIVIEDRAKQIEPEKIRGRELQDVKPGGLGVHVIREVMDEVVYEKRDGGGMRLTMIKHSPAHCAGGPVVGGKGCHG